MAPYIFGEEDPISSLLESSTFLCPYQFRKMGLLCYTMLVITIVCTGVTANEIDRLALLAFKSKIVHDPQRAMSSWNNSLPLCLWEGVTCGHKHGRVIILNLKSRGLVGTLSPSIANLTFLHNLTLSNNTLQGHIPQDLGRLSRLRVLELRNNSFTGGIPANLSWCTSLEYLALSTNKLVGRIPFELASLTKLQALVLHVNYLTGGLPSFLGNFTALKGISLALNALTGTIPDTLGNLQNVAILGLGQNNLSGFIPPSLCNLSSLTVLSLSFNQFRGSLPPNLGNCFPQLQLLQLGSNFLSGPMPASLSNASQLEEIEMALNGFSGQILANFGTMQHLRTLYLGKNNFDDLSFLNSLANCSSLQALDLGSNQFKGVLPVSIANFPAQLEKLVISENKLFGAIPSEIGSLSSVILLSLADNQFTGTIPTDIGRLTKLQMLSLENNRLSGDIPPSLGNLSSLSELYLFDNKLEGTIPPSLGKCQFLEALDLSQNNLNGILPREIFLIPSFIYLILSHNHFIGSLPMEVGHLNALWQLDASQNSLSGEIPGNLGDCTSLEYLVMDGNSFHGPIPKSFRSLRGIRNLSFSHNNLSGQIPQFLETFPFLQYLNLSFNNFEGDIPKKGAFKNASAISVVGNNKLCGGISELHLPKCTTRRPKEDDGQKKAPSLNVTIILILSALLGLAIISSSLIYLPKRWKKEQPPKSFLLKLKGSPLPKVSYRKLHEATDGFSTTNLIGVGSFGSVYKGVIDQEIGVPVAVKVLNLQRRGALKSFTAECEALRSIRHRNLVKIITTCASVNSQGNDFKALVYEFMPSGSLEMWLHCTDPGSNESTRKLGFLQRLDIAIDVASALDYLHHHCKKEIVHCDLKPSNVLLDSEMTAHVGDFGLVRIAREFADPHQSSSFGVRGTIGYSAPEYGLGSEPSASGDVYSYGILLLEMMTGRRPTDAMFKGGLNLHNFARSALPNRVKEIADPTLLLDDGDGDEAAAAEEDGDGRKEEECLISMVETGVACSAESPQDRMAMSSVIHKLHSVRTALLGSRVSRSGIGSATVV